VLLLEAETIPLLENAFTPLSSVNEQAASMHIESTPPREPGWWFILMQLMGPSHPVFGENQADKAALHYQHPYE